MKCAHCHSRNVMELEGGARPDDWSVKTLAECHDCGRMFVPPGTPPVPTFENLLMRTREGIEVVGTLESFSLHYPPAFDSDYVEDGDCINAMFYPDEPSWDCVWAEVTNVLHGCGDMLQKYPYTMEPFTAMDGTIHGG